MPSSTIKRPLLDISTIRFDLRKLSIKQKKKYWILESFSTLWDQHNFLTTLGFLKTVMPFCDPKSLNKLALLPKRQPRPLRQVNTKLLETMLNYKFYRTKTFHKNNKQKRSSLLNFQGTAILDLTVYDVTALLLLLKA